MGSLEEIVATSNLIRKHWIPLELAIQRIVQFDTILDRPTLRWPHTLHFPQSLLLS